MPQRVIARANRMRPLPLAGGQQQMWILQQLDPASPAYLMTWVLLLSGDLDTESLRRAWERVTERHEILRTRYGPGAGGGTVPIIDPPGRFELRTIDLTGELPARQDRRARQIAEWERTRPFDLLTDHPVRVSVLVLGPDRHVVVVSVHHIACDPVSYRRIARELSAFYAEHAGGAPGSPAQDALQRDALQYADFAAWEEAGQADGTHARHLAYWRRALAGLTELPLPLDRPAPVRPDWRGGTVDIDIRPENAQAVLALAARHRASPYMVMLAVYHLMLAHLSGSADIAVGVPVSARIVPELDDIVGYFVNTVVIRSQHDGLRGFADLLAQIRERVLDALDHRATPFAWVVDHVNPRRESGANPLFRVGFDMDRAEEESAFQLPSIQTDEIGLSGSPPAKFELTLHVEDLPDQRLHGRLEFATAVIDEKTAQAWANYFTALLDSVIQDPGESLASIWRRLQLGGDLPKRPELGPHGASPITVGEATRTVGGAPASVVATVAQVWREVLATDVIDVRDNFFDVGGDSLRAVALAGRLRAIGLEVSAVDIFAHQTIEDLAQACQGARGRSGELAAGARDAAVAPFALISPEDRVRLPESAGDAYPLAAMQLGMLIEMRARPDVNSYQDSTSYRIREEAEFDPVALARAVQLVVDRHEVLRTTFDLTSYSVPLQLVHRAAEITLHLHDHGVLGSEGWLPALTEHAARERRSPMDLACAPLIRVAAHTAADSAHWWITITECHPILEGWSFHTMLMEILTGYREVRAGRVPAEPEPAAFRYADYIAAEAEARQSEGDRGYWRTVTDGRVSASVPSAWRDDQGTQRDRYQHMVDYRDLEADLRRLATQSRTSMKAVMLAAHLKVMSMMTGTEDFYAGLVCDARPEVAGADRVLGMYLNTVPFAMPAAARTWGELAAAVYDGLTEMWPHRVFPLQVMQAELGSGGRLLDVFFNYLDFHQVDGDLVDTEEILNDNDNEFALHVFSISGVVRLNTTNHRLSREAAGLGALYRTVLESMSLGPDGDASAACLPRGALVRAPARAQDRATRPDPETISESFSRAVRTYSGAQAAQCGDESLTYSQLDRWARSIARRLMACGVRQGSVVAVAAQRDLGTLAALQAVWMAGAAWMLAEPELLAARLREPGRSPQVAAVVTAVQAQVAGLDPGLVPVVVAREAGPSGSVAAVPVATPSPADDACVLPGGAVLSHGALAQALASVRAGLDGLGEGLTRHSSWLCTMPLTCGVALGELLLPLTSGGRVVLTTTAVPAATDEIMKLIGSGAVSHCHCGPGLAEVLLASSLPAAVTLLASGDYQAAAPPVPDARGAQGRLIRLTEVGELACWVALDGRPVGGLDVRVADARMRPLATGVPGELCVGGSGLADRLCADPAGTAERFVPDPLGPGGSRLYRTGRLARFTSDGRLEQLGPILPDGPGGRQTELYRTRELLAQQASVLDSFVLLRPDAPPGRQLLGYVRAARGTAVDEDELRRGLAGGRLAQQLIPDVLIQVDEWPLDERGAIDAERLPELTEPAGSAETAQPPWDEQFAALLRGALDRVGYQGDLAPDEPLSSSGLDSFGTVGLLLALETTYDVTIPDNLQITEIVRTPRTLWQTIAALCREVGR